MVELIAHIIIYGPFAIITYWLLLMRWMGHCWRERSTAYMQVGVILSVSLIISMPSFFDDTRYLDDIEEIRVTAFMIGIIIGFFSFTLY